MCAINGFNWEDERLIDLMNKKTIHRGPDGTGVFVDEGISLGHNRLSIIDTRTIANQPMESDDKKLVISFNGEIYNFAEVRKELQDSYVFSTNSDTEVILAAYKKWGTNCLSHFNGMFAFAIWNKLDKSLFIARDPVGIKPLYYYWDNGKLIFSSEIKGILEHPISRTLNHFAFSCYMKILYTPEPYTMFEGINKLSPGKYIFLKDNKLIVSSYEIFKHSNTEEIDYSDPLALKKQIDKAVKRQLVSDRPLGIYLSGGMDSTSVLDAVSHISNDIKTFSVGFELENNEQFEKFNKDLVLARRTAKLYKTDHHEVLVKKDEVIPLLEKAVYYLDEPISDATVIPMLKLAQYAKNSVAVVLGGDGGDELFGGYERYKLSLISDYYQRLPIFFRKICDRFSQLSKLDTKKGIEQFKLFMFQKDSILHRVLNKEVNNTEQSVEKFFERKFFLGIDNVNGSELLMNVDQKSWLVDESLMRSDKMSMAGGLEMRVPLLDLELVEYSRKILLKNKVDFLTNKIILRKAMKGHIPDIIINQPKRGWFSPGAKWLRDPNIVEFVKKVLHPDYYSVTSELFNWKEISVMFEEHISKKSYYFNILWSILAFQIWAKRYQIKLK